LTVKELIRALQAVKNQDVEVRITNTNGDESEPIFTVELSEVTGTDDEDEVLIILEGTL
jgi:hypothetical protein